MFDVKITWKQESVKSQDQKPTMVSRIRDTSELGRKQARIA